MICWLKMASEHDAHFAENQFVVTVWVVSLEYLLVPEEFSFFFRRGNSKLLLRRWQLTFKRRRGSRLLGEG